MHDRTTHTLRSSTAFTAAFSLSLALAIVGCKGKPAATDDAGLTAVAQARIASDQSLGGQSIQATVADGVVTLNGSVASDSARTAASADAAQVPNIKTVVNNLTVAAPAVASTDLQPVPPVAPAPVPAPPQKPSAMGKPAKVQPQSQPEPAPIERAAPPPPPAQPEPQQQAAVQPPPPPPPPPAPVIHHLTLAAGTTLPVRVTQTLDSATTQTGDKFSGVIASDIIVDGMVVLPQGTPVNGHVDAVQDAAHFKGSALLTISLTSINRGGDRIAVTTDSFTKEGEGRGKNTAEKVGGGAAVGAILGGIFGGGKGAAIGAAAGGGVGAGANGVTRGQQVQIPSETLVRFRLGDPITITTTTGGGAADSGSPSLERR